MNSFTSVLVKRFGRSRRVSVSNRGFTLTELLVTMLIAGGIVSGLMYMVIELLTADQREATRTQTQQEMQMAMDYIGAELREAVYIYEGACLSSTGEGNINMPNGDAATNTPSYCPGLYNHLPTALTPASNSYPILAFWKQQKLPASVRQACTAGNALPATPCTSGHSYALVVYSLNSSNPQGTWSGRARITRYVLSEFNNTGTRNAEDTGYVNPSAFRNNFKSWPFYQSTDASTGQFSGVPSNRQTNRPATNGSNPAVLVDFVDDGSGAAASNVNTNATCFNDGDATPEIGEYVRTFDPATFTGVVANAPGFYACVSVDSDITRNRDVVLYVRGNPFGRPGVRRDPQLTSALPTLETRVLSRPVLSKSPQVN
ncbi:MAG: prepilin-type N-terminal cleavage/methylation domain-containing protein [Elainellaceae cyanobacterium]